MLTPKFLKKLPVNTRLTFRYFRGSHPSKRRYITYKGLDSSGNLTGIDNRLNLESGLIEYRKFNLQYIAEIKITYIPSGKEYKPSNVLGVMRNLNQQLIDRVYNNRQLKAKKAKLSS